MNATDPDCGVNGQIRYYISESMVSSLDMFSINIDTGKICVIKELDFELQEVYDFPVVARDTGDISIYLHVFLFLFLFVIRNNLQISVFNLQLCRS